MPFAYDRPLCAKSGRCHKIDLSTRCFLPPLRIMEQKARTLPFDAHESTAPESVMKKGFAEDCRDRPIALNEIVTSLSS
jgi:hypothetical protein